MDLQSAVVKCGLDNDPETLDHRTTDPTPWFIISAYLLVCIWRIATKTGKSRKNIVIVYETT